MRIGRFMLEGYIGIYNGLDGLTQIEIDFRKCMHRIVIIRGLNGSGKSTIFNAATPLPDSNSSFVPKMNARKEIEIIDGDTIYQCRIIHQLKNNEERDTAKGYIRMISDGQSVELNPNGNITSYREIIYEHMNLDSSFEQLSRMASTKRGLADKTPSERKMFVSNILPDMEVYNNIYKTLTKRASIFKSYINSLTSKLNFLGTEESVSSLLTSLENRINRYTADKDALTEEIAMHKSTINLLDPDNNIRYHYTTLSTSLNSVANELDMINSRFENILFTLSLNKSISMDEIGKRYTAIEREISALENLIIKNNEKVQSMMRANDGLAKECTSKQAKAMAMMDKNNIIMIEQAIKGLKADIAEAEDIFREMGFENGVALSKEEYLIGMEILKSLKEMINIVKSSSNYNALNKSLEWYQSNYMPDMNKLLKDKENLYSDLYLTESKIVEYNTLLSIAKKLENRPSKCKIDNCFFITDAIQAASQNPSESIAVAESVKRDIEGAINKLEKTIDDNIEILETYNKVIPIFRALWTNKSIISRLPNGEGFTAEVIVERIKNNDNFDDINVLLKYIQYCDLFDAYSNMQTNLYKLEADYNICKSEMNQFNDLKREIEELQTSMNKMNLDINELRLSLQESNQRLIEMNDTKNTYLSLISLQEKRLELEKSKNDLFGKLFSYEEQFKKISSAQDLLSVAVNRLATINKDIVPLIEERDEIKHSLRNIQQYKIELAEFSAKYEKVQTIKDEASPTKGIQTLFVELYMGTIINMANDLLKNFFAGKFKLLPFTIDETQFTIPCQGSGMVNDDISSMSDGEVAMISMILSFSIMIHSSNKYNIPRLDEADGALDVENRMNYLFTLETVLDLMKTEMCIMISHNTEMTDGNCDLILLKLPENANYQGNIIFKY